MSFFIGSVWNNELNQGNRNEISSLRRSLAKRLNAFIALSGVSDAWNAKLIRISAAAPAIGGAWQVAHGYLPCRFFKNVAFGHLGCSNIPEFVRVFSDATLADPDIESLIDAYFSLPPSMFSDMVHEQQTIVRQHTYENKLTNIIRALEDCRS